MPFENLVFRTQSQGGPAWARLGPGLGRAWARLGPGLGPGLGSSLGPGLGPGLGPDAAAGAGAGAAGRILKSRSRPLPTHPGMKYFREETLAVDKELLKGGGKSRGDCESAKRTYLCIFKLLFLHGLVKITSA